MNAKQAAGQETKIENCPMPGCGVVDLQESGVGQWWYECETCGYRSPRRDTKSATIAAHNALATASARPKDSKSYENVVTDMAREIWVANGDGVMPAVSVVQFVRLSRPIIAAKLSELMQPKDVAGLEDAVRGCADEIIEFFVDMRQVHGFQNEVADIIIAAVRDFCDPETLRQRDVLLVLLKMRVDEETCYCEVIPNLNEHGPCDTCVANAAIADCEATK